MATVRLEYSDGSYAVWHVTDSQADKADYDLRVCLGQPHVIRGTSVKRPK